MSRNGPSTEDAEAVIPSDAWGTVHPVASHQVMPATLVPNDSRRHFITCKFCQPSKLFLPMPLSDERHRLPSCCRQQRVGSRRFDTSSSRYLELGKMMATPGRQSLPALWPFQRRMTVQRMREQRLSLRELSSLCLPVVVRPVLDAGQIGSADEGSLGVAPKFIKCFESERY
jgi:hypothetical protein